RLCTPRLARSPTRFLLSPVRREVDRRPGLSDPRRRGQPPRADSPTPGRRLAQRHHPPGRAAGEGDLPMTFTKPWIAFRQDLDTKVPLLDVFFRQPSSGCGHRLVFAQPYRLPSPETR